ncbi:MAG: TspO/MBR family protein [Anaerovoracaceae bacterium]
MKNQSRVLVLMLLVSIPLVLGSLTNLFTGDARGFFDSLTKPLLSPPGYVFPIVWTILYLLMGVSSCIIYQKKDQDKSAVTALGVYYAQLIVNLLWSFIFFGMQALMTAFWVLIVLWILIAVMINMFLKINKFAAYIQVPYLIWVTFAGYLNLTIALMN